MADIPEKLQGESKYGMEKSYLSTLFMDSQSVLSKEIWVSDLLSDKRLDTALSNAIGTEGEFYSELPKLFDLLDDSKF